MSPIDFEINTMLPLELFLEMDSSHKGIEDREFGSLTVLNLESSTRLMALIVNTSFV